MRKAIALFAVLIGAFGVIGLAGASPASAANCTANQSTTYWNGVLNWNAILENCTGVDAVEFDNTSGFASYWDDRSSGVAIFPTPSGALQQGGPGMTGAVQVFSHAAWCGGLVHTVATSFVFRIHNSATHTWGSKFRVTSNPYAIQC